MADYLPLVMMFVLATLFAGASFIASGLLAPEAAHRGQGGAVRVRHRADAVSRPSASRCASISSR